MPTQIDQIRDAERGITILRVDGEMFHQDAAVIEKITAEIREETGDTIMLDLADLDFLDSEAAPILRRLASLDWFEIDGIEIFLQSVINDAERRGR